MASILLNKKQLINHYVFQLQHKSKEEYLMDHKVGGIVYFAEWVTYK